MSSISKQALIVENNTNFPDNNTGYITPSKLREFNLDMIDSTVNQATYSVDIAAIQSEITALEAFTASQQPSFAALNTFTASQTITNSNLNSFTQSATQELDSLSAWTGSWEAWTSSINEIRDDGVLQGYSTRFFFNGLISASIVQNVDGPIANVTIEQDGTKLNTASFNDYTASTAASQSVFSASVATSFNTLNVFTASQNTFNASITSSVQELLDLSSSLSGGYATQGELDYSASVLQSNIDTKLDSSSFNSFTESFNSVSGTFATTGSNTFTGDQTLIDAAGNSITLSDASGSLYLVAKGFTSASLHLSASAAGIGNLIFKSNNNTADTIISGSDNIFPNPATPTAGFKRYVGSSNIFTHPNSVPQISGSMGFSPTVLGNIFSNNIDAVTWRGPVSASAPNFITTNIGMGSQILLGTSAVNNFEKAAAGVGISNNAMFGGVFNLVAKDTTLTTAPTITNNMLFGAQVNLNMFSSSVSYLGNIQNGGITVNNSYNPIVGTTVPNRNFRADINTIYGISHALNVSGSNGATNRNKVFSYNILAGSFLTSSVGDGDSCNIISTGVIGNALTITGSTLPALGAPAANAGQGSLFAGRFNALDGNKAKTAETIFAVGTGTSYTNRKTGFLIDSGSNTFVEGTLNVNGSLSFTGSVFGNVSASVINFSTASIDLSTGNYFTLTMAGTTNINVINPRPGVTATLVISTSDSAVASFSNNVKQPSGSLYVASPSGNVDIISFTAVDSNTVYAFPAQSFV